MKSRRETFSPAAYLLFAVGVAGVGAVCICIGSVGVPLRAALLSIWEALRGMTPSDSSASSIIVTVRLPRVLCVALTGAALSVCGAAMQGLLKNPLADGSTLGVSSGASLGAVIAIACGLTLPGLPFAGTTVFAVLFAFGSLALILALAFRIDSMLSTNTIILIGVIFSMFASSAISLLIALNPERVRHITFWTMGSLAGTTYTDALLLLVALICFGGPLCCLARPLNAFAVGEENARSTGVNVRAVRMGVLVCASGLIGVTVSVGGTIGFVGLVIPHIMRLLCGPNHRRLLPGSLFAGAGFLMLADLAARTLLAPRELPIGTLTSLIGSVIFIIIFARSGRGARR